MKLIKTASGKKKIKISKFEWQNIGKQTGWMKTAMPVGLSDDIRQQLGESNWLVDLLSDKVPPDVGITKLRGIDPDVALSLPRIYNYGPNDIKEIDGQRYIIIDMPKKMLKRKPTLIKAINIDTGETVNNINMADVLPQLQQQIAPLTEETKRRVNEEIRKHNDRLDAIDKATANITLLPLQLARVSGLIDERVADLDGIIGSTRAKLESPKPEPINQWESEMQQDLIGGDLDEVDFVDTALHTYKYRYNELVEDLKNIDENGNPKEPNLSIPANIDNPEQLRVKLMNMGELAFNEYVDAATRRRENKAAPGVDFDIDAIDFGYIDELTSDEIKKKHQTTGYRSWGSYESSLETIIRNEEEMKQKLIEIKQSLTELGQRIGGLEAGQRSNDYLRNTPEGRQIVDELREFINGQLGQFITQYKTNIIKDGVLDRKKMGSGGSIGNGLLVVAFGRMYQVISTLLGKISGGDHDRIEPERVPAEVEEVPAERALEEPIAKSKDKITRMSELLWGMFESRMRLR